MTKDWTKGKPPGASASTIQVSKKSKKKKKLLKYVQYLKYLREKRRKALMKRKANLENEKENPRN